MGNSGDGLDHLRLGRQVEGHEFRQPVLNPLVVGPQGQQDVAQLLPAVLRVAGLEEVLGVRVEGYDDGAYHVPHFLAG